MARQTTRSLRSAVHGGGVPGGTLLQERIRLGRVAGIGVGVNWSVLVVVWLLAWSLAVRVFPREVPGQDAAAYWTTAVAAAVLFLGSVLAHELGHALVARRNRVGVEGITLWLLGGVTRLTGRPATPGAELRIAMAGPLTSMAAAVAFGLLAAGGAGLGLSGLVVAALGWLAGVSVVVAAFNLLIPAAPLDGGRILRAVWWGQTGDRRHAAVTAARAGRLFGWLLVGGGVAACAVQLNLAGLWVVLLGCFLGAAARTEVQEARRHGLQAGIRIRDVMAPLPLSLHEVTTVAAAGGSLVEVPTVAPNELLVDVLPRLAAELLGDHALVIEEGKPVGVLWLHGIGHTAGLAARRGTRTDTGMVRGEGW
jgi:Zn-dependent protease